MASSQKITYNPVSPISPETSPVSEPTFPSQVGQRDERLDSISLSARSDTPIVSPPSIPATYPPHSSSSNAMASDGARRVQMPDPNYDAERAARPHFSPNESSSTQPHPNRPHSTRNPSWDLLSGIKRFEHGYEEFDSRNASEAHLAFADGDMPNNKFSKFYHYLLNVSIVTRWFLFIVPVLGILWIPGILGITTFPDTRIWAVKLLWWSIWLSVVWGGWWGALAASRIFPSVLRSTIGVVAVATRRYVDWMEVLHRYVALFAWTLVNWVSFNPLIDRRQEGEVSDNSRRAVDVMGKLLFAFFVCSAVLLFEKFSIQWIAGKFHERSYAERIADQKFAVKALVTLYRNSRDILDRTDTLHDRATHAKNMSISPGRFFKKALKGVRIAATTTTTAFGNVASEIAGTSVLQPNSPQAMVQTALSSANKSRLLARRLFYSFAKKGSEYILLEDVLPYFPSREEAEKAFALFDQDGNGDATRDEVEMACMEFHREQLSIEHSMQDLDSAVGRLDNILMSVYVVVAALIIAVALETQLVALVTGAGTLILGLSWLIGGSLQEVLTSIIFLFIKHPFDVGDRINLEKGSYTVKEIRLLSTVFLDSNGTSVQAPNVVLNGMFIQNIRRSPQMSETFTFDVHYSTSFEALEKLRDKMLQFLKEERRDYHPVFDVNILDFPEQEKMKLSADIKYKSNFQQGALKAKRRNKWICALKSALAEVKIHGPKGDPDAEPSIARYTEVPWQLVKDEDQVRWKDQTQRPDSEIAPVGGWRLRDRNSVLMDPSNDIFGEGDELRMTSPRQRTPAGSAINVRTPGMGVSPGAVMPTPVAMPHPSSQSTPENIEMAAPRR
ncbi:Mechanosensitive ion channel protein [Pleurotus pulmonarius]